MKNTICKLIIILIAGVCLVRFIGCKLDHGPDGHTHAAEDIQAQSMADDHGHGNKEVHLNQAQFENAEIDTGWFVAKNLSDVVNANGYTKLDPQDEADVSLPITGTVQSVKVIEGNYVKMGQTLATMVSLEYNRMLLDLSELKEELGMAEANYTYLQQTYEREKGLAESGINAKMDLQKAEADLKTDQSRIQSIKQQIQIMQQTVGLINTTGSPSIPIKAPIAGYITDVNVKVGSVTIPGSPLFSIVDNSQMHVDVLVYEKDLEKVKVGQKVRFILTNQSNQEISGNIYNIGKSFASETKSVAVHADIDKNDANLIPGMYVNALIDIGDNKVETLPEGAIVFAEGKHYIFLYVGENDPTNTEEYIFERLEVKTGARQLGIVAVTPLGEIHDGDRIVTGGAYYLQSHLQKSEGGGGHHH